MDNQKTFTDITTTDRAATTPGWGAARDGFFTALATAAGVGAVALIRSMGGDPELAEASGELAREGVLEYGPIAVSLFGGFGGMAAVGIGKMVREWWDKKDHTQSRP